MRDFSLGSAWNEIKRIKRRNVKRWSMNKKIEEYRKGNSIKNK